MWQQPTQWETCRERPAVSAAWGAVACIWAAVVAISAFSPDLVSGSEQEHLPVAALGTWIWGLVATRSVLTASLRLPYDGARAQLTTVVGTVWVAATAVSIFGPRLVTGSDPTSLPIAAMVAPTAAALITAVACEVVTAVASSRR